MRFMYLTYIGRDVNGFWGDHGEENDSRMPYRLGEILNDGIHRCINTRQKICGCLLGVMRALLR